MDLVKKLQNCQHFKLKKKKKQQQGNILIKSLGLVPVDQDVFSAFNL